MKTRGETSWCLGVLVSNQDNQICWYCWILFPVYFSLTQHQSLFTKSLKLFAYFPWVISMLESVKKGCFRFTRRSLVKSLLLNKMFTFIQRVSGLYTHIGCICICEDFDGGWWTDINNQSVIKAPNKINCDLRLDRNLRTT